MSDRVTVNELSELPLRAVVAFAVRCARRVQPLFDLPPRHPKRMPHIVAVNHALDFAERLVAGKRALAAFPDADDVRAAALDAQNAADAARNAASATVARTAEPDKAVDAALDAANRAVDAEDAARAAAAAARTADAEDAARAAFDAARAADANGAAADAADAARADFEQLTNLKLGKRSELGEPIDLSDNGPLGPLWPTGEPTWYREKLARMQEVLAQAEDEDTGQNSGDISRTA